MSNLATAELGRPSKPAAWGGLLLALFMTMATTARAQAAPESPTAWRWYGWQTLSTDGAGVTLLAASVAGQGQRQNRAAGVLVDAGLTTLVLGAPVVHAFHGRWGAAAGSLALRTALPAFALVVADQPCEGECSGALLLLVFALTAPVALDAAALSWERESPRAYESRSGLRVRPYASARRKGVSAGLVANF